ncbi:P12 [Epinotia aporema granulovirus]|uniref:p12 n=1 Tax=Epinotia aporema granulovirus TaxID=166056 RepID=K4ERU7_9BBAC|nr:P12 [Epinotia aporema granulovirus]AER41505.1 P12 [Epinotia aporema granulovirus]
MVSLENSLFGMRPAVDSARPPPPTVAEPTPADGNEAVLQALLMEGVGNTIRLDESVGKRDVLTQLMPKTRGLQKLINNITPETSNGVIIRGADDAVELLEVVMGIVNSKFVINRS